MTNVAVTVQPYHPTAHVLAMVRSRYPQGKSMPAKKATMNAVLGRVKESILQHVGTRTTAGLAAG
jgi:hypothetical protein